MYTKRYLVNFVLAFLHLNVFMHYLSNIAEIDWRSWLNILVFFGNIALGMWHIYFPFYDSSFHTVDDDSLNNPGLLEKSFIKN